MAEEKSTHDSLEASVLESREAAVAPQQARATAFPAVEIDYWRGAFAYEPYVEPKLVFDDYLPAYGLGWRGHAVYGGGFQDSEGALSGDWDALKGSSALTWEEARPAVYAAWQRAHNAGTFATDGSASDAKALATLGDVLHNARDGEAGYHEAAQNARTHTLATLFARCAASCGRAASELEAEIRRLGGEVAEHQTVAEAAHRVWVQLRGFFGGAGDEKMLQECERGEDAALERYRQALADNLPANLHAMLVRQYELAQRHHFIVRTMRERAEASSAAAAAVEQPIAT